MFGLDKKITEWVQAGILNSSQAEAILSFERNKKSNAGLYSIITLGAVAIGIGIISLIAFNWKSIPDSIKLSVDFLALSGVAFSIYKVSEDPLRNKLAQILGVFLFLLIGGSIGLISQIYNTGGELYQAATLWAVISLGFVILSTSGVLLHFWIILALGAIAGHLEAKIHSYKLILLIFFVLVPQILFFLASLFFKTVSDEKERQILATGFYFWSTLFIIGSTIYFSIDYKFSGERFLEFILGGGFLASLIAIGFFVPASLRKVKNLLYIILIIFFLFITYSVYSEKNEVLDAVLFILLWFMLSFVFYSIGYKGLFNFFITGIGFRFLVVYFQVFGSLASTGFGLIFSGLLIIVLCILYIRNRNAVEKLLDTYL